VVATGESLVRLGLVKSQGRRDIGTRDKLDEI